MPHQSSIKLTSCACSSSSMASCLSESSSTSNTETSPPNQRERENPENHKEGDEEKEKPMSTGYYQTPWIYSQHLTTFTKPIIELDLISGLSGVPSGHGKQELVAETPADPPKVYGCNYCDRKFHSSQALGGHQNAHKSIRALANPRNSMASQRRPQATDHQYSSLVNYASFGRSSNGVVPQSMFRKPPLHPMLYRHNDSVDGKAAVARGMWIGGGGGSGLSSDGKEEVKKLDLTLKI